MARRELTPALAWVLEEEYGESWWEKGIREPLRREDSPYLRNLPTKGNQDDLDLYLCLKLTQINRPLFVKHLQWDPLVWKTLAAVFRARNEYEGHITKNREESLTTERAREVLQNISLLLLRLHENHESDSIALMKPLAQALEKADFDTPAKDTAKFRPPEKKKRGQPSTQWKTVAYGDAKPVQPVNKNLPPDLRDVKISPQLHPEAGTGLKKPVKPKSPTAMAEIPSYLTEGVKPIVPPRRRPRIRSEEDESEEIAPEKPILLRKTPVPPPTVHRQTEKQPAAPKSVPKRRTAGLPEDPYAVVPAVQPTEREALRRMQSETQRPRPSPTPRKKVKTPIKEATRSSRKRKVPKPYKGWQGVVRWILLLAIIGLLVYLLIWLDNML